MGQKVHPVGLKLGISTKHQSRWFYHKRFYRFCVLEDKLIRSYISKVHSDCQPVEIFIERSHMCFVEPKTKQTKEELDITALKGSKRKTNTIKQVRVHTVTIRLFAGEYHSLYSNKNDKAKWTSRFHNPKRFKQPYPRLPLTTTIDQTTKALSKLSIALRNKYGLPELKKLRFVPKAFEFPTRHRYTSATMIANHLIKNLENRQGFRRSLKMLFKHLLDNRELSPDETEKVQLEGLKIQIAGRLDGVEKAKTHWISAGKIPSHTLRAKIDYCSKSAQTIYGILGIKVWAY